MPKLSIQHQKSSIILNGQQVFDNFKRSLVPSAKHSEKLKQTLCNKKEETKQDEDQFEEMVLQKLDYLEKMMSVFKANSLSRCSQFSSATKKSKVTNKTFSILKNMVPFHDQQIQKIDQSASKLNKTALNIEALFNQQTASLNNLIQKVRSRSVSKQPLKNNLVNPKKYIMNHYLSPQNQCKQDKLFYSNLHKRNQSIIQCQETDLEQSLQTSFCQQKKHKQSFKKVDLAQTYAFLPNQPTSKFNNPSVSNKVNEERLKSPVYKFGKDLGEYEHQQPSFRFRY